MSKEFLGPPPTEGLKPLKIAVKNKKGKWLWQEVKQTRSDKELRDKWNTKMKRADEKGIWRFKWKPE